MISFYKAGSDADYMAAKLLFEEYAQSLDISLEFQHFGEELTQLKTMYGPPVGGILLAEEGGNVIGCVGVRRITESIGELKRMYIQPAHQQRGIGRNLLQLALQLATDCNYSVLKLDTLATMQPAIELYRKAGFYEVAPYYHNPIETAVYFEKQL